MKTPYHLLTTTANIVSPSESKGQGQMNASSFLTDAIDIQCAPPQPLSATEGLTYARETGQNFYKVFLAPTKTNGTAYTLTHDCRLLVDGVEYTCAGDARDVAGMGVLKRVDVFRQT